MSKFYAAGWTRACIASILPKLDRHLKHNLVTLPHESKFACDSQLNHWRSDSLDRTAMIRAEDIGSLTDFQRNTQAHLKRLRRTGRPELLTVNGKAEVVVQNASAYQRLIQSLEKLKRDSLRRI